MAEEAGGKAILVPDSRPGRAIVRVIRTYGLLMDGLVVWHEPRFAAVYRGTGNSL